MTDEEKKEIAALIGEALLPLKKDIADLPEIVEGLVDDKLKASKLPTSITAIEALIQAKVYETMNGKEKLPKLKPNPDFKPTYEETYEVKGVKAIEIKPVFVVLKPTEENAHHDKNSGLFGDKEEDRGLYLAKAASATAQIRKGCATFVRVATEADKEKWHKRAMPMVETKS